MARPKISPDVQNIALRLQQVLEHTKFQNAKIGVVVLAERGNPKHTLIDVQSIEPKAADLSYLLFLLGINPDMGVTITVNGVEIPDN